MGWSAWMILPMFLAVIGCILVWAAIVALAVDAFAHRHHRPHTPLRRHHTSVP